MAKKQRKLGRGLSALIAPNEPIEVPVNPPRISHAPQNAVDAGTEDSAVDTPEPETKSQIFVNKADASKQESLDSEGLESETLSDLRSIEISSIEPSRYQPRRVFDEQALQTLADSIHRSGLMQPILVRRHPDADRPSRGSGGGGAPALDGGVAFELVAGERRWRAAQRAGLDRIPARVLELSEAQAAEAALIENVQREDLNPIERAWALRGLGERFDLTHAEIGQRVGLERSSVANLIRLTDLEEPVQALLGTGALGMGHGRALLGAPPASRVALAERAEREGWSVRRLEAEVKALSDPARTKPKPKPEQPVEIEDLQKKLGEHLGTKVRLKTNADGSKGTLTLEFYGLDHFDGLLAKLGYRGE